MQQQNRNIEVEAINWLWNSYQGIVLLESLDQDLLKFIFNHLYEDNKEDFIQMIVSKTLFSYLAHSIKNDKEDGHLFNQDYFWQVFSEDEFTKAYSFCIEETWKKALDYERERSKVPSDVQIPCQTLNNLMVAYKIIFNNLKKEKNLKIIKQKIFSLLGLSELSISKNYKIIQEFNLEMFKNFCLNSIFQYFNRLDYEYLEGQLITNSKVSEGYIKSTRFYNNGEWFKKVLAIEKEDMCLKEIVKTNLIESSQGIL